MTPEQDIFLSFIMPLGRYIHSNTQQGHHAAMTNSHLISKAEQFAGDDESLHKYSGAITEALVDIFSSHMTTLGVNESTTVYTIYDDLPSKDCYKFINLLMVTYAKYHEKPLPANVQQAIEEWLVNNEPTVKSAGKRG